jgi:glycine hydroxymethyltransferase
MRSGIIPVLRRHERLRAGGLNLVASENSLSERVRSALSSDLAGRYGSEWYGGSRHAREIVEVAEALARKLFRAKHAVVTPLSGNLCDLGALFAFTAPGEKVAMIPFSGGGYPFGVGKFHRKPVSLPVECPGFPLDAEKSGKIISRERPALTILGASYFLFPQPVRGVSACVKRLGTGHHCVYDGSHVLGLIACGAFQDPLREGAELLFGSTHKSFFGPQGGILLTNSAACAAALRRFTDLDFEGGIGLVDNPHVNRIAALGLALEEMLADPGYGKRVVENAKTLAGALDEQEVPVRFRDRGYTESHQLLLDLDGERAAAFCRKLDAAGIFIDRSGRIGTAEITHRGLGPAEVREIARWMAGLFHGNAPRGLKKRIRDLAVSKR